MDKVHTEEGVEKGRNRMYLESPVTSMKRKSIDRYIEREILTWEIKENINKLLRMCKMIMEQRVEVTARMEKDLDSIVEWIREYFLKKRFSVEEVNEIYVYIRDEGMMKMKYLSTNGLFELIKDIFLRRVKEENRKSWEKRKSVQQNEIIIA